MRPKSNAAAAQILLSKLRSEFGGSIREGVEVLAVVFVKFQSPCGKGLRSEASEPLERYAAEELIQLSCVCLEMRKVAS